MTRITTVRQFLRVLIARLFRRSPEQSAPLREPFLLVQPVPEEQLIRFAASVRGLFRHGVRVMVPDAIGARARDAHVHWPQWLLADILLVLGLAVHRNWTDLEIASFVHCDTRPMMQDDVYGICSDAGVPVRRVCADAGVSLRGEGA